MIKRFDTGNTWMAYSEAGPEKGRPVLFLHGVTVDHVSMRNTFEPYFSGAAGGCRRVYPDFPGHGASDCPLTRANMPALLEDTAAFIRGNFDEPPAVVGYSFGGFVALKLAEKVRFPALFLVAPPVCTDKTKISRPKAVSIISDELTQAQKKKADARYMALAVKRNERTLERYNADVPSGFSAARLTYQALLVRRAGFSNIVVKPRGIESRTTFLVGQQDTLAGYRDQFNLATKLKGSEYHSFYDCGHFLPHECRQFGTLFQEWLRMNRPVPS